MKTKRILSFLLAIAMLAAMTISASATQATKVYLAEDFTAEDGEMSTWLAENYFAYGTSSQDTIAVKGLMDRYNDPERANGRPIMAHSTRGVLLSATQSAFITNSLGSPAIKFVDKTAIKDAHSKNASLAFVPYEPWNALENEDETYVISYEIQFDIPDVEWLGGTAGEASYGYICFTDSADRGAETTTQSRDRLLTLRHKITDMDENTEDDVKDYQVTDIQVEMFNNKNSNGGYKALRMSEETLVTGKAYRLAQGFYHDPNYAKSPIVKIFAVDGNFSQKTNGNTDMGATNEMTHPYFAAYQTGYAYATGTSMANFKMYTIKNGVGAFNVSTTAGDVVPAKAKVIPVKFSQPVAPENFDATAVTVTKNGEALVYGADYSVTELDQYVGENGGETYSTANVVFEQLDMSSEYVITFPTTITNEIGTTLAEGYNKVEFITPEPDIKVNGFDIIKGFATADEEVVENFVADGNLQVAKLAVENTTTAAKNVAVIYAVYGANGQLNDVVYANNEVEALSEANVMAGTTLSAAGTVKAFVWDGISSLNPHTGATVKTIIAAAE